MNSTPQSGVCKAGTTTDCQSVGARRCSQACAEASVDGETIAQNWPVLVRTRCDAAIDFIPSITAATSAPAKAQSPMVLKMK